MTDTGKDINDKKSDETKLDSEASCPYYRLVSKYISKIEIPTEVKDLILWKNPKYTGAVFGSALVLLISLASFSLLTVIGTLFLVAMSVVGTYRLYLTILFRIKGTYDETFDKLSAHDFSLPKDQIQELARLLDTDVNKILNKLKSIVLWDNVIASSLSLVVFYFVYCVGCVFNTLTILILAFVSAFTLPKVYLVYQKPIDKALIQATNVMHETTQKLMAKLPPFLQKKKVQ